MVSLREAVVLNPPPSPRFHDWPKSMRCPGIDANVNGWVNVTPGVNVDPSFTMGGQASLRYPSLEPSVSLVFEKRLKRGNKVAFNASDNQIDAWAARDGISPERGHSLTSRVQSAPPILS
jgi:hypothetical protein